MNRIKTRLRNALLRLPGGRFLYQQVYAPVRRRFLPPPPPANLPAEVDEEKQLLLREAKEAREALSRVLALQEEWGLLMREVAEHVDFLLQHLKGEPTEGGAQALLAEHERHLKSFRLALHGLLARHEAQVRLAEAVLVAPVGPEYVDRVRRLEKVIEYLVNLEGDDPPA